MRLTMKGKLTRCLLLAYRVPIERARPLVPDGLELLTHRGYAFWNVVVAQIQNMRPVGLPAAVGWTYHHVGYRFYVRARTADGRTIAGLHFLRSDVAGRWKAIGGNLISDFKMHPAAIDVRHDGPRWSVRVDPADGLGPALLEAEEDDDATGLNVGSCFASYAQARQVLTYAPVGLSTTRRGRRARLAEVFRDANQWVERPLRVHSASWPLIEQLTPEAAHLELATWAVPLPYRWRLGRTVRLADTKGGA